MTGTKEKCTQRVVILNHVNTYDSHKTAVKAHQCSDSRDSLTFKK